MIGDDGARTLNTTKHANTPNGGFTRAGGAEIAVSENALQEAKAKLGKFVKENIPKLLRYQISYKPNMMKGFTTAGGASIEVFEEALREAMKGLARDTKPAPALKCRGQQKTKVGG